MLIVNVEELVPGMRLAEDAVLLNGRRLLCVGVELTEKHIRIFKMWGLSEAHIEPLSAHEAGYRAEAAGDPTELEAAETELRGLFQHTDLDNPAMAELFRLRLRQHLDDHAREKVRC